MRSKENKSVLKTIRLTNELEHILQMDAKSKKIKPWYFSFLYLNKYAEWDKYYRKVRICIDLGQKWSEILALVWADGLIKNTLGLPTHYEITNNSLVIRFSEE